MNRITPKGKAAVLGSETPKQSFEGALNSDFLLQSLSLQEGPGTEGRQ